jgi:8-oxo-dGTP pyrophosphatase MutT (NUDIX family)
MYKIYINETPLLLLNTKVVSDYAKNYEEVIISRYPGKSKMLLNYIDMLEKTDRYDAIILSSDNEKQLFKDFKSLYKRIDAAGGIVFNPQQEILFIFRRGYWDLPKGKIDKGEKKKAAAIREVKEETGLKVVDIISKYQKTYHTYRLANGSRILKYTYWYLMQSEKETLTPQAEEDIEQAVWISKTDFLKKELKTYGNIMDLINRL